MRSGEIVHDLGEPAAGPDLTAKGRDLAGAVVPAHLERQAQLLSALSPQEQATLADLLRALLRSLEG